MLLLGLNEQGRSSRERFGPRFCVMILLSHASKDLLRRYNEIFKGAANATQCFASAQRKGEQ